MRSHYICDLVRKLSMLTKLFVQIPLFDKDIGNTIMNTIIDM